MTATNGSTSTVLPLTIGGKEIRTSTQFSVVSPDTSEVIWECSSASREDAVAAVEAAARAFPAWSNMRIEDRRRIFLKAADILEARAEECQMYMAKETGALAQFSGFNITASADLLREIAGGISTALMGSIPVCQEKGTNALVVKEPYGVCLGIAPW
jgi:acyl-CoA reductase-like NAD-dependent aldehyde dehydrogenase